MVVKLITDDDGDLQEDKFWHMVEFSAGSPSLFCSQHVFGEGESSAEYITKKTNRYTCPACKKRLKALNGYKYVGK